MCGIIGYTGEKDAQPILLDSLKRLEYRGYDSVGIATISKNNLFIKKDSVPCIKKLDFEIPSIQAPSLKVLR